MNLSEMLKGVTAGELHAVIDADIAAQESGTPDAVHLVQWFAQNYPELLRFAHETPSRYLEDSTGTEYPEEAERIKATVQLIKMNTAITLGAICRLAAAHDLPPLGPDTPKVDYATGTPEDIEIIE